MEEKLININKALFGYETKEEMERATQAAYRWWKWHHDREPEIMADRMIEQKIPTLLKQGKEEEAYEMWLAAEFYYQGESYDQVRGLQRRQRV